MRPLLRGHPLMMAIYAARPIYSGVPDPLVQAEAFTLGSWSTAKRNAVHKSLVPEERAVPIRHTGRESTESVGPVVSVVVTCVPNWYR